VAGVWQQSRRDIYRLPTDKDEQPKQVVEQERRSHKKADIHAPLNAPDR
jgi:hypothetical protein